MRQSHLDEERQTQDVRQIQGVHLDHLQAQSLQSQGELDVSDGVHREIAPVRPDSETDSDIAREHPEDAGYIHLDLNSRGRRDAERSVDHVESLYLHWSRVREQPKAEVAEEPCTQDAARSAALQPCGPARRAQPGQQQPAPREQLPLQPQHSVQP